MKTKLVTAIYSGIHGYPYYGHQVRARMDRYLNSLRVLNNMDTPIICYCGQQDYDEINEFCNEFNLTNVQLKISELADSNYSPILKDIKDRTNNFKFYHEVDYNKLYLLDKENNGDSDYLYWIDAGLSHRGLFLLKYNPNSDKITGMSDSYHDYEFTGVFNPELFPRINNFVGNKLLSLQITLLAHNPDIVQNIYKCGLIRQMSVGGIIGGKSEHISELLTDFKIAVDKSFEKDIIINHEAIMTVLVKNKPEMYEVFKFDTWYHNDFHFTSPDFPLTELDNKIHFVHFFEKTLGL